MKTNFHKENFALRLAFIMRLKATRKWSIVDVKFDLSAEDDREQD